MKSSNLDVQGWLMTRKDVLRPWRYVLSKNRNLFLENWRRIEVTIFTLHNLWIHARTKYFLHNLLLESSFYQISIINLQNDRENYKFNPFTKKEKFTERKNDDSFMFKHKQPSKKIYKITKFTPIKLQSPRNNQNIITK